MSNDICVSDPVCSTEDVIARFGGFYRDQTDIFFKRAVSLAAEGRTASAYEAGRFAFDLSAYAEPAVPIEFLAGFLAQVCCDLGRLEEAGAYYRLGRKSCDPDSPAAAEIRGIFDELAENIKREREKRREQDGGAV